MNRLPIIVEELLDLYMRDALSQLAHDGIIYMTKPEIQQSGGGAYAPLPEDDYNAIIVGYRHVDRENADTGSDRWDASERDFYERDKKAWAAEQQEKSEADADYHPKPYPAHRRYQYWFSMKVVDGEFRGRFLPRKKTTVMLSSFEKNGLFKFLKVIPGTEGEFTSLAERIDAGDAPDFDDDVVGKVVKVTVEHNIKGDKTYEKLAFIGKSKYKPTTEDVAELVLGAKVEEKKSAKKDDSFEEDIPF